MEKEEKIIKILEQYNLGKISQVKRLTAGYANENYLLKTNRGKFLFRIFKEKTIKEINYEMNLMNILKKINFLTAFPIRNRNNYFICKSRLGNIVIYEYIEGKEPKINNKTVKEIARATAKLNSFKGWRKIEKKNAIGLGLCLNIIKKYAHSRYKYPEIFEYFKAETIFLKKYIQEKVPQGLIHGDIFPDNTKFNGNKLIAILDFEEACTDNLLFDMGISINGFCFKNNHLDKKLLDLFLKEYGKTRKISTKEKLLLPYYIKWAAHAMIAWHFNHLLYEKDARKLNRVNYLIERVRKLK